MAGGTGVRAMNGRPSVRSAVAARHGARGLAILAVVAGIGLLSALAAWQLTAAAAAQARSAAHQVREVEASAAAESGLAWWLGRLNGRAVGPACEPAPPGSPSFAERWLVHDGARVVLQAASAAFPPTFACVRDAAAGDGWRCDCSGLDARLPPPAAGGDPVAAFAVTLQSAADAAATSGVVVRSIGCVRADGDCRRQPGTGEWPARVIEMGLGVTPLLVALPSAVWTATGRLDLVGSASARNRDGASAGLVLHAGGPVSAGSARVEGQRGAPPGEAVAADDAWLAGHDFEALARRLLGVRLADFAARPAVQRVACEGAACGARVAAALTDGARAVFVTGDAAIDGPVILGSPDRPVLVVVDGRARVRGPATVHGLVLSRALEVDGVGAPVDWIGAGVAAGDIVVRGAVDGVRDAETLSDLASVAAAWLPMPGSWRDRGGAAP